MSYVIAHLSNQLFPLNQFNFLPFLRSSISPINFCNYVNQVNLKSIPFEEGQKWGSCQPPHFYAKQNNSFKRYSISITLLYKRVKEIIFLSF